MVCSENIPCPSEKVCVYSKLHCSACPAGTYLDRVIVATSKDNCSACPAGTFGTTVGANSVASCINCPVGFHSQNSTGLTNASQCRACKIGMYAVRQTIAPASLAQLPACFSCPSGRYSDQIPTFQRPILLEHCQRCARGMFTTFLGGTLCFSCPKGWFATKSGSQNCSECDAGFYQNNEKETACVSCESGNYQDQRAQFNCSSCPKGWFATKSGSQNCAECDAGFYQNNEKSTACFSCPSGHFQDKRGRSNCSSCPIGFYSKMSNMGLAFCNRCEPGRYQIHSTADDCEFCGKFNLLTNVECVCCSFLTFFLSFNLFQALGQYQNTFASTSCVLCEEGKYTGCQGKYECEECPVGRTSKPKLGGTHCIAERVTTSQPQILRNSHMYTGDQQQTALRVGNLSSMCISWKMNNEEDREIESLSVGSNGLPFEFLDGFFIQWSFKTTFPPPTKENNGDRVSTNQSHFNHQSALDFTDSKLGPWTFCFNTSVPVHLEVVYVRVIGITPIEPTTRTAYTKTLGTPSLPTNIYPTAQSCGDVMYLSQSSHPPSKGLSIWEIGAFNRHIEEWRCR